MILAMLAIVTASLQPPAPKVGDLITIDFNAPVVLERSQDYEIVSSQGTRVVVRTFTPKPFVLSGTTGNVHFTNLVVPVRSVLRRKDDVKPAPLAPPRPQPYPREPFIAIAIAAALALLAWAAVWWRSRVRIERAVPQLAPEEMFRRTVLALRQRASTTRRWADLADATRSFLAATRPQLGSDLTTRELLPRLGERELVVAEILRQGDLEKFSTRGPAPADFDDVATRVLLLAAPPTPTTEERL